MPLIPPFDFPKRYYYSTNSTWSGGARWAFFALSLVAIALVVMIFMRINRSRMLRGVAPIYGTTWMTPPSYRAANPNSNNYNNYVPAYTATANEADMGYYDNQGYYHPNPNVKSPDYPEQAHYRTGSASVPGVARPGYGGYNYTPPGDVRSVTDEHTMVTGTYERPPGPPPSAAPENTATGTGTATATEPQGTGSSEPVYSRPDFTQPLLGKS
ncbi:hypothetical protein METBISCDRAFT_22385 [Metschnikowia bicuspidata]|uniref:Uncharacterized protein n=1 Tax=Metschnikowia bicuspidata TaxID=27322 RepID=A0A4P9ZFA8_9ASCO|nr:hypothetical protein METBISCDRAFT_22385 [Metschnikowia bicuspidata]